MILELNNSKLKTRTEEILEISPDVRDFALDMIETMKYHKALGLSANQVGSTYRMFVFGVDDDIRVAINPKILDKSGDIVKMREGCLSFPNYFVDIKRNNIIRVRYTTLDNDVQTHTYMGLTSRVFQHEMDHLDGITIKDRASLYHKIKAENRKQKLDRKKQNV